MSFSFLCLVRDNRVFAMSSANGNKIKSKEDYYYFFQIDKELLCDAVILGKGLDKNNSWIQNFMDIYFIDNYISKIWEES